VGLPVRGQLTVVRPATEADADLLVAWHLDPEVSRYWDDETFTRDEIVERLRRSDVDAWIVEADGGPVGYLQSWWDEPGVGGLDMFLVPAARGRGLGPDAARALAHHLLDECGWTRLTVDPYLWNEPAIRAWTLAGFRPVEERHDFDEDHAAPWLLMEWAASGRRG
jgi:aminoglycoside 6'-N-acetyltransferase